MRSLFINTSNKRLIIGIVEDDKVLYEYSDVNNNDLSSRIMPIIDEAFTKSDLKPTDIDTIFVTNGPGSFTGIRIGLTIAKVMAWSLKIKVVPLSTLELMVSGDYNYDYVLPLMDARRDNVFGALYDKNLNPIINDSFISYEDIINKANDKVKDYVIVSHDLKFEEPKYDIVKIIKKHINDKGINPHELNPNYLKMTEAEENLNKKEGE